MAVQMDLSSKPLDTWVSTELEKICSFSKYLLSCPMCLEGALLNYFKSVGNTVVNKTEKIVPSQRLFL